MKPINAFLVFAVLLCVCFPASAAEFMAPSEQNKTVNVTSGETHHNLYAAGSSVNINADVTGDLYAAGGVITLNSKVEEDLNASGGNLTLNGAVGDDARLAGGTVVVNSPVASDLLIAGGNINLSSAASVGADLAVAGGVVVIESPVNGKVWVSGGEVRIDSKINGEVVVYAETLTFGAKSEVLGKVVFHGPKEAVVETGAKVSSVEFIRSAQNNGLKGVKTFASLVCLFGLLVLGGILMHFKKQPVIEVMQKSSLSPLSSLGTGLLTVIVVPIVVVLLFATLIGFYLAILLLLAYIILLILAYGITAIYIGSKVVQLFNKKPYLEITWITLIVGVVALKIIGWLPIVGSVAIGILCLITLGSLVKSLRHLRTVEMSSNTTSIESLK